MEEKEEEREDIQNGAQDSKEEQQTVQNDKGAQRTVQDNNETQQNEVDSSKKAEGQAQAQDGDSVQPESEGQKEPTAEEKLAALQKENAELKDQLLRRAADFDNYRKRMIKEKQDAYDYANTALLQDLLESLDNLERTVDAAQKADDPKAIADGVKIIGSSLVQMLESKYNLTSFGQAGDDFNPDFHEAIGSAQEDVEKPVLKEVYLKGYKLKDKVIRNAKVMVSMPKEK